MSLKYKTQDTTKGFFGLVRFRFEKQWFATFRHETREREKEAKRKQTIRFFLAGNHLHFRGRPPPRPRAASPPSR